MHNSYFPVTPKNHRLKKNVCFYNIGEEIFLKVAPFVTFPISVMVLLQIHQRFKGHFLNEGHVSFNISRLVKNINGR